MKKGEIIQKHWIKLQIWKSEEKEMEKNSEKNSGKNPRRQRLCSSPSRLDLMAGQKLHFCQRGLCKAKVKSDDKSSNRSDDKNPDKTTTAPKGRFFSDLFGKLQRCEGLGTLEIVVITAVLLAIAMLFREQITRFAKELMEKVFSGNVLDGLGS